MITLLFLVAIAVRRRRSRLMREQWEREEREESGVRRSSRRDGPLRPTWTRSRANSAPSFSRQISSRNLPRSASASGAQRARMTSPARASAW